MLPAPPSRRALRVRVVLPLLVVAGLLVACGGGDGPVLIDATAGPSTVHTATLAPTPTALPTPTPVPEPEFFSPFNGMPLEEESLERVLAIKIDNHRNARPQVGIQHADMIVEIFVEGTTRLLSVWQSNDADVVGPIRSMRPTDFSIQKYWQSLFINSGGQDWVAAIGNRSGVQYFVEPPDGTFRDRSRVAPHQIMGVTSELRNLNSRGDYDEPLEAHWNFGPMPDDAEPVERVTTRWVYFTSGTTAFWEWNEGQFERSQDGRPHMFVDDEGEQQQITADTLIVFEMEIRNQNGGEGTKALPVTQTVGSGPVSVFADGMVSTGTWSRSSDEEWFTLTYDDGEEMTVPPGRLWMILGNTGRVETT
jgi:Protein of unknown function (DUF3048) N-terminal domain/Protein of unknown function (DUF3048) C-terminal domain